MPLLSVAGDLTLKAKGWLPGDEEMNDVSEDESLFGDVSSLQGHHRAKYRRLWMANILFCDMCVEHNGHDMTGLKNTTPRSMFKWKSKRFASF